MAEGDDPSSEHMEAQLDLAETALDDAGGAVDAGLSDAVVVNHLTEDIPEKVVPDRMNVGQDVLDKHYNKRDEEVKVKQRRGHFSNI